VKIRFHSQEPPMLGHYFKSERGQNAYHIVGIKRGRVGIAGMTVFNCEVEKVQASRLPDDAEIIPFQWFSRGRRT
jgi:hypothetical protein